RLAPSAVVVRGLGAAARASTMKAAVDHPLHVQILRSPLGYALPPHSATPRWRYAANSRFLATIGAAYLGCLVDLVPSLVEPRDYAGTEKGDAVLFINPIADKGVHVALAIAERLPRRKFIFVRSWPKHPDHPEPEVRL